MEFNHIIRKICIVGTSIVNMLDFPLYKKHYNVLLSRISSPAHLSKQISVKHKNKWKQLSKRYTNKDLRLFASFIDESEDILPENISHDVIEPILNPVKYRPFYEDKNQFDRILPQGFLPKTYLRRIGGYYYDASYQMMDNPREVYEKLCVTIDGFVVKPTIGSSSGKGVRVFKDDELPPFDFFEESYKCDFIVQELLRQHESISRFNASSINTLRILVYRSPIDGQARVINCALRVGQVGSQVDNAHMGGYLIGVSDNGVLCDFAVNQDGVVYKQVNTVDLSKKGIEIPEFSLIKEFACDIARNVTHHRLLATDIAVCQGENGHVKPVCVEFNLSSLGTWAFQYTNKPVLGDYTDEIINYCKTHKKEAVKFYGIRN